MQAAGRIGPHGWGRCLSPSPAPHCREVWTCPHRRSQLSPILIQGRQSPKQVSTAHGVRRAWLVGLQFPALALHPRTAASPQTCRRVRSERAGTHQGLSNNLVERERDRKTTGSEGAAQPLSFPDKAREVSKIPYKYLSPGPLLPHEQDLCPPPVWPLHQHLGRVVFGQSEFPQPWHLGASLLLLRDQPCLALGWLPPPCPPLPGAVGRGEGHLC